MDNAEQEEKSQTTKQARSKKHVIVLCLSVVGMFGFAFALVPLYDVFCEVTGLNGKGYGRGPVAATAVDESRWITIEFIAHITPGMPWAFAPEKRRIEIRPGATNDAIFIVENHSQHTMTGQAVPSVSPGQASGYLTKIECFCFQQQILKPGESARLPVKLVVSPELPDDIEVFTLSYTLFDISSADLAKHDPG